MALHRYEKNFIPTGVREISDITSVSFVRSLLYMRVPFSGGLIKRLAIWTGSNLSGSTSAVFNLSVNGTYYWDDASRPAIAPGDQFAEKTGLSIAVNDGDILTLDLVQNPRDGSFTPLTMVIEIEDGIDNSGGFNQEQIEDIVGAMFQTGSNMSFNYNDATGKLELDSIQLTTEEVQDKVGALLSGGANTTVTYNDGANTLTIAETSAGKTQEEIEDIIAALLQQGSNVTLNYNDAGNTLTIAATGGGGGGGTLAGDVTGAIGTNTVSKIQNRTIYIPLAPSGYYGDDFNDNSLNLSKFVAYNHNGVERTLSETGNKLQASVNDSAGSNTGVKGITAVSLVDRFIQVKLVSKGASSDASVYFGIFNGSPSGEDFIAGHAGTSLGFSFAMVGTSPASSGMYPLYSIAGSGTDYGTPFTGFVASNTFYRLEHNTTDGNLYWKTSPDGTTWTTRRSVALSSLNGFDFTQVKVAILGGDFVGGIVSTVQFDDLTSNLTEFDILTDKSLLWYNSTLQQFEQVSLANLKAEIPINHTINVQALTSSPVDAQTIYFGMLPKAPITTANVSKCHVRKAGKITSANIGCYSGTAGTGEAWSLYIRVNNTTDYLIATLSQATNERIFYNDALNIPLAVGDYFEIKAVNPTWSTNPLTCIFGGYIHIE